MRLPESLIIAPYDIPISVVDGAELGDDRGQWLGMQQIIRISADIPNQLQRETLLHEAIHAIWGVLDLPTGDEETIIERLSPALMSLCRFNPALKGVLFGE